MKLNNPKNPNPPTSEEIARMYPSQENDNLTALDRIIPPPTIRSQRRIVRIRLIKMQEELNQPRVHILPVAPEVKDTKEAA
jgi:hypothetical protein